MLLFDGYYFELYCMHPDTTSEEYLIKLPIGDSDFSFVIKTIVHSFEFKFK